MRATGSKCLQANQAQLVVAVDRVEVQAVVHSAHAVLLALFSADDLGGWCMHHDLVASCGAQYKA